jgi:hypothetical protein
MEFQRKFKNSTEEGNRRTENSQHRTLGKTHTQASAYCSQVS